MGAGETTFLDTGVWLVPLILIATIAVTMMVLYLLVHYWRNKTLQDLKQIRAELRSLSGRRKQLLLEVQEHSPQDPEPYGSQMAMLQKQLDGLDQQTSDLESQNVVIQDRIHRLASNQWQSMVGAPYFWFLIRRDMSEVLKKLAALQTSQEAAEASTQKFHGLSWEVAQQAREIQGLHRQVSQLLEGLQAKNLGGEGMNTAAGQAQQHRNALAQISPSLVTGEETEVRTQAQKEEVAQAHAILTEIQPELKKLLEQIQAWEKQHGETVEKVTAMRQLLGTLDQALADVPANLNLTALQDQFDELKAASQSLHATLARPDVERLGAVGEEAVRVQQSATDLGGQVKQARQHLSALEALLPEVGTGLKSLSAHFGELGTHSVHPITWDQSRIRLTTLSRQASSIGPIKKPRTPEQVNQDLKAAIKLNEAQKELTRRSQEVAQQHGELEGLLSSPQLSQGMLLYQRGRKVLELSASYDPENWSKVDSLATLPEELRALKEGLEMLVTGNPAEPVNESQIEERLKNTRELAQFSDRLSGRVENIQSRLTEIQRGEDQAQTQLETTANTLNQVALLVRSNAFLAGIASGEIGRLQEGVRKLDEDLADQEHGTIEKKAKAISSLADRVEQNGNAWIDQLNRNLENQRKALSQEVSEVEAAVSLDEPALAEARRLLSAAPASGASGPKARFKLEELLLEMKRRSEFWQSSAAALRALQDQAGPVLENYAAASQNRQFAKQELSELTTWMRTARAWPPISLSLDAETQELEQIERQWEALKRQPARAIQLVSQLANLSAKYVAVADKARNTAERASQEQGQVTSLESELDELAQLWQSQWQSHQDNPVTTDEIRKLLNQLDQERDQIKRQYRQGAKNYGQVMQALQALRRTARIHQVPVDDSHVIDVNGRLIAYR